MKMEMIWKGNDGESDVQNNINSAANGTHLSVCINQSLSLSVIGYRNDEVIRGNFQVISKILLVLCREVI